MMERRRVRGAGAHRMARGFICFIRGLFVLMRVSDAFSWEELICAMIVLFEDSDWVVFSD
jgi:hypothetical protein